ncbi:hypothetical protein CLIB1444_02S04038 [[Candida] jaroonii]|uniref:Uncharacterized protein n=1 Tax=[Candida] jaroonii TaxID=467808 RepID=A0ACA9Y387_9ASCO|nr:hypothetical protein CLIB1444_02S04038 [[Candida] jaroonii]
MPKNTITNRMQAFIVTLIGAGYLGFSSIELPHDKLIHFITFFLLTLEFFFIFQTKKIKQLIYITFIICTLGGSIASEFLQNFINPSRIFDINDIFYNVGGSIVALIISGVSSSWNRRRRYKRLDREDVETEEYININMQDIPRDT